MTLDEVMCALLYRRGFRERFRRGERQGIADEDVRALATLDPEELERAARFACSSLLTRSHRGVGTLLDAFPETVEAWRRAHPGDSLDELAMELADAPGFEAFRASSGPDCIALEEAFYRFVEESAIGDAGVRLRELVTALMRGLVVTPRPFFRLPAIVRAAPRGHFAVHTAGGPMLVAALDGRLVVGAITPFLAAVLTSPEPLEEIASRFGVADVDARASFTELARLGLVA